MAFGTIPNPQDTKAVDVVVATHRCGLLQLRLAPSRCDVICQSSVSAAEEDHSVAPDEEIHIVPAC
jgi:hypothetical protein